VTFPLLIKNTGGVEMNTCVACGNVIPEGIQVCKRCELIGPKELIEILIKEREDDGVGSQYN